MKPPVYFIIFLSVAILFFSCNRQTQFRERLLALDSAVIESPDSVYEVLNRLRAEAEEQSESDRMYYELLKADAQNKAYVDFTTDSVMLNVAEYYDKHGTPNEKLRAYYLLGCTYRDLNDVPMELQYFQEAVERADTTQNDCNWRMLVNVYGQMADLYNRQYLPYEELKAITFCEKYSRKTGDSFKEIYEYSFRHRPYFFLGMLDSVLSVTTNARQRLLAIGDTIHAASILGPSISILIDEERYDEAEKLMEIYEKHSGFIKNDEAIDEDHVIYFHDKGRMALHHNKMDLAKEYFLKLLPFEKESAYDGLLSLYEKLHIPDSMAKYSRLYATANDTSFLDNNAQTVEQMTAMYNYSRHEKIAKEKTIESANAKNTIYIILIIAIITTSGVLCALVFFRYRSKEKERIHREHEKILLTRYNETKDTIRKLEHEKETLMSDNIRIDQLLLTINRFEEEKQELEAKLMELNLVTEDVNFKAWYEDFIVCDATKQLHAKTIICPNKVVKVEEELWSELRKRLNSYCPAFLTIIDSYQFNPTYQKIVLLNIFDFSNSEISVLFNKTNQQISNIHNRISKKMFPSSADTRKLKQNIQKILREKKK